MKNTLTFIIHLLLFIVVTLPMILITLLLMVMVATFDLFFSTEKEDLNEHLLID